MAKITLFNSLGKSLQEFNKPLTETVTIYSCGPTVYDNVHIGNLTAFIYADTLKRLLTASGYPVKHVMNITDVDDKTIARAAEIFHGREPLDGLKQTTEDYTAIFMTDIELIGIDSGSYEFIKATDNIEAMQQLITKLYQSQFAYIADDGVYFSIAKYRASGKTYGQLTEVNVASTSQSRVNNDEYDKADAQDFALWKKAKAGEPAWPFSLNNQDLPGRPGWHIECSAMSRKLLGQPFDIHTGGVDLKFPHHENEIAQSTAAESNPELAHFFVHNEHLLVNGQKMSKSLNNYLTLRELTKDGRDPIAFRLMVLSSHYQKQADYSDRNFRQALDQLEILQALADNRFQALDDPAKNLDELGGNLAQSKQRFLEALQTNLDTPLALQLLMQFAKVIRESGLPNSLLAEFNDYLSLIDATLGLKLTSSSTPLEPELQALIGQRAEARAKADFAAADSLRKQLNDLGYGIDDTSSGQRWYKKRRSLSA